MAPADPEPAAKAQPAPDPEPAPKAEPGRAREPAPDAEPAAGVEQARHLTPSAEGEPAPEAEPVPAPERAAEPEAEPTSELVPANEPSERAPSAPRSGWWLWLLIICFGAALLGLAAGVGVVLRGRSFSPSPAGEAVSRPTFVIAAPVSPRPSVSPSPVVTRSSATADYFVEVQPGDTLRSIAQTVYGDANQWPRIYDANRDSIGSDPDALQAGMRLRIP